MNANKPSEKVNWIRTHEVNGFKFHVSEKSGIVKIEIPGVDKRAIMGYADELLQLMTVFTELQRYLEANVDVAVGRDASKELRKSKQVQTRAATKAAEALSALGLTADDIKQLIANKQKAG